jgi:chitinase
MRWVRAASAALLVLAAAGCHGKQENMPVPSTTRPTVATGKVVGYYADWDVYARGFGVKELETSGNADRLTDLVYAFGATDEGRCRAGDAYADYQRPVPAAESVDGQGDQPGQPLAGSINQLRKLKLKHPRLKVLWSFGGWSGSKGFTTAAAHPGDFADSCAALIDDPRWAGVFDGIDLDWEYPNACGLVCDTSGRDGFAKVVSAVRARLGPGRLVSAAVSGDAKPGGVLEAADYASAVKNLDWVNAMTYDYFGVGAKAGPTAPHSPLTAYPGIPDPEATVEAGITRLRTLGVPAAKILLGVGLYGRGWTGVSAAAPGGSSTGPAKGRFEAGVQDYKVLAQTCPPTGTAGGTAYAWCKGQWWSYDTPATVTGKLDWAVSQGLGGAFVWELSGDTSNGTMLTAISTCLHKEP